MFVLDILDLIKTVGRYGRKLVYLICDIELSS